MKICERCKTNECRRKYCVKCSNEINRELSKKQTALKPKRQKVVTDTPIEETPKQRIYHNNFTKRHFGKEKQICIYCKTNDVPSDRKDKYCSASCKNNAFVAMYNSIKI
jgi:hypothetical protein